MREAEALSMDPHPHPPKRKAPVFETEENYIALNKKRQQCCSRNIEWGGARQEQQIYTRATGHQSQAGCHKTHAHQWPLSATLKPPSHHLRSSRRQTSAFCIVYKTYLYLIYTALEDCHRRRGGSAVLRLVRRFVFRAHTRRELALEGPVNGGA